MFLMYSLMFTIGVVLSAPYYLWRLRGHILSPADWRERFGFLPDSFQQPAACPSDTNHRKSRGPCVDPEPGSGAGSSPGLQAGSNVRAGAIWIHAVSVGETLAVAELVRGLHQRYPARKLFMSHVTPAGREAGERRLPSAGASQRSVSDGGAHGHSPSVTVQSSPAMVAGRFLLPLDWHSCVTRALDSIQPSMLIVAETELWPNLLRTAHAQGARVVLVNARLSQRSFRGYRRFNFFIRRVLENVDVVCAQTPRDAERFRLLGVPPERVMVTGNMKFDVAPPLLPEVAEHLKHALKSDGRSPVVVAASTMPGEEPCVLEAWGQIRSHYPRALMVLAPRHPVRFDSVARLLSTAGVTFIRRTALESEPAAIAAQLAGPGILLLDTIGELAGIFEVADVVFVGGSLVPTGGHNLLEPAYWGKPILFGPHMDNFRDTARIFLEARAALEVKGARDLGDQAVRLLEDASLRTEIGNRARELLQMHCGATVRNLEQIADQLGHY